MIKSEFKSRTANHFDLLCLLLVFEDGKIVLVIKERQFMLYIRVRLSQKG